MGSDCSPGRVPAPKSSRAEPTGSQPRWACSRARGHVTLWAHRRFLGFFGAPCPAPALPQPGSASGLCSNANWGRSDQDGGQAPGGPWPGGLAWSAGWGWGARQGFWHPGWSARPGEGRREGQAHSSTLRRPLQGCEPLLLWRGSGPSGPASGGRGGWAGRELRSSPAGHGSRSRLSPGGRRPREPQAGSAR